MACGRIQESTSFQQRARWWRRRRVRRRYGKKAVHIIIISHICSHRLGPGLRRNVLVREDAAQVLDCFVGKRVVQSLEIQKKPDNQLDARKKKGKSTEKQIKESMSRQEQHNTLNPTFKLHSYIRNNTHTCISSLCVPPKQPARHGSGRPDSDPAQWMCVRIRASSSSASWRETAASWSTQTLRRKGEGKKNHC